MTLQLITQTPLDAVSAGFHGDTKADRVYARGAVLSPKFACVVLEYCNANNFDFALSHDEFEGWFAAIKLSDVRGPYSATVNATQPSDKTSRSKAASGRYEDRLVRSIEKAIMAARRARVKNARIAAR